MYSFQTPTNICSRISLQGSEKLDEKKKKRKETKEKSLEKLNRKPSKMNKLVVKSRVIFD